MFNKSSMKWVAVLASTWVALALTGVVQADCTQSGTPLASTVQNLKGTMACTDIQSRVGCTISGSSGTCTGSGITASIQANSDGSISWTASSTGALVTEALVAGTNGGNTCEYVYSGGSTSGTQQGYLKSTGSYQGVQSVSLCTSGITAPQPKTTPTCESIGVTCPSTHKSLIYKFDLDTQGGSFYNAQACVCNNGGQPLLECNPNVPAGQAGACPTTGTKTGTEVTTHIELNNDPYYCATIGGTRTCYYYTY